MFTPRVSGIAGAEVLLGQGTGELALRTQLEKAKAIMKSSANDLVMTEEETGDFL